MTREQIKNDIPNMPSRIESMKASDFYKYVDEFKSGERSKYEIMMEIYERGIVDGRMWQQYIDRKGKTMTDGEVYTLQEVSEILKVTYRSALSYVESGKLSATKIGGKWRVRESDLQSFVKADK